MTRKKDDKFKKRISKFKIIYEKTNTIYNKIKIRNLILMIFVTILLSTAVIVLETIYNNSFTLILYNIMNVTVITIFTLLFFKITDYISLKLREFTNKGIFQHVRFNSRDNLYEIRRFFFDPIDEEIFISIETKFKKDLFIIKEIATNNTLEEMNFALSTLKVNNLGKPLSALIKYVGFSFIYPVIRFIFISFQESPNIIFIPKGIYGILFFSLLVIAGVLIVMALAADYVERQTYILYFQEAINLKKLGTKH